MTKSLNWPNELLLFKTAFLNVPVYVYEYNIKSNEISLKPLPSQHVLDTVICESQEQVSFCHLEEISKSLPALSDHSSECPGQRMDHPKTRKMERKGNSFYILDITQFF